MLGGGVSFGAGLTISDTVEGGPTHPASEVAVILTVAVFAASGDEIVLLVAALGKLIGDPFPVFETAPVVMAEPVGVVIVHAKVEIPPALSKKVMFWKRAPSEQTVCRVEGLTLTLGRGLTFR